MKQIKLYINLYKLSLLLGILGFAIGALINNFYLAVVLFFFMFIIPKEFKYIKYINHSKFISMELQSTLSVITSDYIQNDDIIKSIRDNLKLTKEPLSGIFREFIADINFLDANVENALSKMRSKLDNSIFSDWCNTLIMCQKDRELKYSLISIVEKISDIRRVQDELDTIMFETYKEIISMVIVSILSFPMMLFINKDWFFILYYNPFGKIIVSILYLTILISAFYSIKANKPIQYK